MRAGLLIPCYLGAFFPEAGIETLELLERLGRTVVYPLNRTCRGQPMANSGCEADVAATEAHFVRCFQDFATVVGPSGSCVHHVRAHLDAVAQTPNVREEPSVIREVVECVYDDLKVGAFPWASFPLRVGLRHSSTAIRGLRHAWSSELVNAPPFAKTCGLLAKVRGLELVELDRPDECCRSSVSFYVSDKAVSAKMGYDRVQDFHRHGAEYIA